MTYPVTVYRWDDAGAPQISTDFCSGNELKAILQACLVTGYGSKAGLGWSKLFDDANGVVWQNNVAGGGSGGMFRLRAKSGNWTTGSQAFSTALEIMSAKSFTSTTVADKAALPFTFAGSSVTTGVQRGWVLIGTAIGFFFEFHAVDSAQVSSNIATKVIHNTGLGHNANFYVGDIIPMIPGDAYKFTAFYNKLTLAGQSTMSSSAYSLSANIENSTMQSTTTNGVLMYDSDGGTGSKLYNLNGLLHNACSPFAANAADPMILAPVVMTTDSMSATTNTSQSAAQPFYRGRLPGVSVSLYAGGTNTTFWPHVRSIDSQNNWLVGRFEASPSSQGANCWVNMVEW